VSTLERTREHVSTALVNGRPVGVHQGHRVAGERYGPVLVTVAAPVALTLAEVAAVLFRCLHDGACSLADAMEDLADDDYVRRLVAELVVNQGGLKAEDALFAALDLAQAHSEAAVVLAYCSQRALAVFGEVSR
jgi:hypothetical protein